MAEEAVDVENENDVPDKDLRQIIQLLIDREDSHVVRISQIQRDGGLYSYYELKKNYR